MTTTSFRSEPKRPAPRRAIGPAGTLARLAVGAAALAKPLLVGTDGGLQWHEAVIGLLLIPAVLILFQVARTRRSSAPISATGPLGVALITAVGLVLANIAFTSDAAFVFLGTSTLLAAARGYAGCEVLAIGNWLLRRNDQVGCLLFSPIDAVEEGVTRGAGKSRAA